MSSVISPLQTQGIFSFVHVPVVCKAGQNYYNTKKKKNPLTSAVVTMQIFPLGQIKDFILCHIRASWHFHLMMSYTQKRRTISITFPFHLRTVINH